MAGVLSWSNILRYDTNTCYISNSERRTMTRYNRMRASTWAVFWSVTFLASCSDDPSPTAPPPVAPPESPDRPALVALYNATGGANWRDRSNWLTATDIGTWHGVETDAAGHVTELSLPTNNLTGAIPPQLGDLSRLRRLLLYRNELSGTIPPELGKLGTVTRISLSSNNLAGSLPPELGALANLDTLILHSNELSGPIPPELANMASLEYVSLALNSFSGPVPPEIGGMARLKRLSFSGNQLTGTIPPELGTLRSIESLSLSRNNLTGPIPAELGGLATLERLYLYRNQLSGEIPPQLGKLSRLDLLRIEDNELSGTIPPEIVQLPKLTNLLLSDNALTGGLPSEIGEAVSLTYLFLSGNPELRGLLPRSMLTLDYLVVLEYDDTGLCAQIDDEFQQWLRGVPGGERTECDVGDVEELVLARLHELTGGASWTNQGGWVSDAPVDGWFGITADAGRVIEISLPGNGLQGPLPGEIANLGELTAIDLYDNDLVGDLPASIASLSGLQALRVADNPRLDGVLPFAFRQLESLRVLHYDGTDLCASPSASFQAWFAGIDDVAGATCENLEQVTLSLPIVYLTQAIQSPSRGVRLIAGRDALLRVFVAANEPRAFFEPDVIATFTRSGEETHRVVMQRDDDQIPTEADEGDLTRSYNALIPGDVIVPGAEMVVEFDPGETVPLARRAVRRVSRLPVATRSGWWKRRRCP